MSQVITFVDYRPPARFDSQAWVQARVEEAATAAGPWALIDTLDLDPLDVDPTQPAARSLTTDQASDDPALWYRLTFIDYQFAQSLPTVPIQNVDVSGYDYLTLDEIKAARTMLGQSYADAEYRRAITTASRASDLICGRRFWLDADATQVRYYTPTMRGSLEIDDIVDVQEVATDPRGDRTFERTWTVDTDYHLGPLNAQVDGRPWERILPAHTCRWLLPTWALASVRVTGQFGWLSVPAGVSTATLIMASRYVLRQREAPFAIVTAGMDVGAVARIGSTDPEVMSALADFRRGDVWLA